MLTYLLVSIFSTFMIVIEYRFCVIQNSLFSMALEPRDRVTHARRLGRVVLPAGARSAVATRASNLACVPQGQ